MVEHFPSEYAKKIMDINKDFINSQIKKYNTDLMKEDISKELLVSTKSISFDSFKEIFEYASSYKGMNLTYGEAKEFAIKWMEQS